MFQDWFQYFTNAFNTVSNIFAVLLIIDIVLHLSFYYYLSLSSICFKLATYIAKSKKANSSQQIKYNVT